MKTLTQHDELLVKPYIDSKIQTLTNQVKDMNNVYGAKNFVEIEDFTLLKSTNRIKTINLSNFVNGEIPSAMVRVSFTVSNSNLSTSDSSFVAYASGGLSLGYVRFGNNGRYSFTFDGSQSHHFYVYIANSEEDTATCTISDIMVSLVSITDDTYVPYAKTNQQLTEDTTVLFDNLEVNGAVNMLPNEAVTQVHDTSGLTFTVNDDKSVTISPTSGTYPFTTTAQAMLTFSDLVGKIPNGIYKLSGCPSGGSAETYFLYVNSTGDTSTHRRDIGEGTTFNYVNDTANTVYIRIMNGTVLTKALTFKPMITVPSYNGDYVPYAKSNKELTVRTDNKFRRTRKDITNYLDNLVTAIAAQDLESYGYSIGDYFVGASGYKYHLADMDTYYGSYASYAVLNTHHIGIVVQTGATAQWNTSGSTSTGYSGSNLHTYLTGTVLNNIKSDMIALFGGTTGLEHLLSHQKLLTNNVSAWAWVTDQYISALSEVQVYSSRVWGIDGYQTGEANKPLQIFQKFRFNEVFGSIWFWLRDIMSASDACYANGSGDADPGPASASSSVVGLILFH